jgi:hypothetical protein
MMRYVRHISNRKTPQSAPITGENQVRNSAGGYAYQLDRWARLRRFLILGSEGNTYYASEHKLTRKNAACAIECIREDGPRAVEEIVEISFSGRAPKNDPAVLALALCTAFGDDNTKRLASSNGTYWQRDNGLSPIDFSRKRRLDDVLKYIDKMPFGGTDCALPMLYATEKKISVDVFVVYTDSETWAGNIYPSQALREYRQKINPAAKLIVVGMVSNGFTIADSNDRGMLDICGFDTAAPALMAGFAKGEV